MNSERTNHLGVTEYRELLTERGYRVFNAKKPQQSKGGKR